MDRQPDTDPAQLRGHATTCRTSGHPGTVGPSHGVLPGHRTSLGRSRGAPGQGANSGGGGHGTCRLFSPPPPGSACAGRVQGGTRWFEATPLRWSLQTPVTHRGLWCPDTLWARTPREPGPNVPPTSWRDDEMQTSRGARGGSRSSCGRRAWRPCGSKQRLRLNHRVHIPTNSEEQGQVASVLPSRTLPGSCSCSIPWARICPRTELCQGGGVM